MALQNPNDYIDTLEYIVSHVLEGNQIDRKQIISIGIDLTSCTMLPIDRNATPLSNIEQFKNHFNAYVKLWKHHGARLC